MRLLILIISLFIFDKQIYATHAAGMDISYECISQGTNSDIYKITVKFYRDCSGNPAASYDGKIEYSSSCGSSITYLSQIGSGIALNPQCATYCNGGTSLGIEEYTYQGNITLSHCSDWVISACEENRNGTINTIVNPINQELCIEATLNNTIYCNNSPTFSQNPTPFICVGNYYCYNNGATEIDGDSLVFSLVTPLNNNNGGTVNYIAPYSASNPVGGGSSFDPITGNLCVTPNSIISGVLAIKISEYRNGIIIGSIIRDIQINTFACTNNMPPSLSAIDTTSPVDITNTETFSFELNCPNGSQNINFNINTINNNPPPPTGYEITINVGGGSWQSEVSWDIYDPSGAGAGTILVSGGAPFSGTVCIPSINLGNLHFRMYDSWGDGWNGNTYTLSGNNTLSGTTSGTLNWGSSYGVNSFNINGGNICAIGGGLITMNWNNGIPMANFTVSNNYSMNPIGTFNWTPTTADIAGSPYFFTVEVVNDACPVPGNFSFQYQIILTESNIVISPTIINPSCNGLSNGSINTQIIGLNNTYNFNWSNGQSTQNITNLNAGTYNLIVTDSLGCTENETYILIDPPVFSPTINTYNISCFGSNDGLIEVVNEPSSTTYLWSNSSTSNNINNLSAGNYSVNVTDSNGCVLTEFFNIVEPSQIIVNSTSNDISCYGANDGNIDLTISGGLADYTINMPPYSQILSNGVTNYYSQSILSAGTYIYTIIDSNNCTVSDTIIIIEPDDLTTNPTVSNVLCKNENNGSIILNITGGTLPYIEDFGGNNPLQLSPGFYTYNVIDSNGCLLTDTFSISEPDSLLSQVISTDATCAGYFDGTASLSITGGTVPYIIDWFGNIPNSLNAGFYNYSIIDDNGCISNGNVTINEPLGMQITIGTLPVSCYGGSDGVALTNVSGGAGGPYNINWGAVDPISLPAGAHIVTVTDSNNCYITDTAFITQPNEISTNPIITHVSCFGDNNGSAILQITGGVFPYNQTWFGIDSSYLAPGTYSYQVTDANNCVKDTSITIYEPDTLKASATIIDIDCFGNNNGAIYLDISGGTSPYSIDFGTFDQYALVAGTYNYTITDVNGCSFDSTSTVIEANEIFLDLLATSPICRYDESTLSINISNALSNTYTIILQDSILKSFVIDTNGLLISNGNPITLSPNFSGKINIISLTDNQGCTQTFNDSVHIEVKQLPELTINEDDICVGEASFILNKAIPIGGTYFINNIMTNYFDVENFDIGNYAIRYEYTDPLTLCYNEITETITISESPDAGMLLSPQPTNIEDPNILFRDNSSEDILSSEWHLGDGTIIYDELDFWHTYNDIGTFMVEYYITNMYGCSDSVKNQITIFPNYSTFIPDAFSPNNDGKNDFFMPSVIGENGYNIKIFDRWGNIIYNEDNKKWDGKIKNKYLPNGTYNYSITIFDFLNKPFIYTGMVNLIR